MAETFQKRLTRAMAHGNMTLADASRWFGRRHSTVRGWLNGRKPSGRPLDVAEVQRALAALERVKPPVRRSAPGK